MASATVNVARWSALAFGVLYGFKHHNTLKQQQQHQEQEYEYHKKEELIKKAKLAWQEKQTQANPSKDAISNPDDPNFDLEKYLVSLEK